MNIWSYDNASMMEAPAIMAYTAREGVPGTPTAQFAVGTTSGAISPLYFTQEELQQRLPMLIHASSERWTYAIFWQSPMAEVGSDAGLLVWGGGYYNGILDEEEEEKRFNTCTFEEQVNRKNMISYLNTIVSGGASPDDAVKDEVTDTEWFYIISMTSFFPNSLSLQVQAYLSRASCWISQAYSLPEMDCGRARRAQELGIETMVCIPVGRGVLELGSTDLKIYSTEVMNEIKVLVHNHLMNKINIEQEECSMAVDPPWKHSPRSSSSLEVPLSSSPLCPTTAEHEHNGGDVEMKFHDMGFTIRMECRWRYHPTRLMRTLKDLDLEIVHATISPFHDFHILQANVRMSSRSHTLEQLRAVIISRVLDAAREPYNKFLI